MLTVAELKMYQIIRQILKVVVKTTQLILVSQVKVVLIDRNKIKKNILTIN